MSVTSEASYREITNETGRVFRIGEDPKQILGYSRWVPIIAGWVVMMLAGLLEYTWGALSGSLQRANHWNTAWTFWLFSFFVVFESFIQPLTGLLRNRGILPVRQAVIIGGIVCGIVGYGLLALSNNLAVDYLGYAVLGGIGSGMCYSSAINIVLKWYPEKKGWRTGFLNGGWAYGAVPFILVIGGFDTGGGAVGSMTPGQVRTFIIWQGIIMTVGIVIAGLFMKDPPKNWWPKEVDPLAPATFRARARDLVANPPALRHYNVGEMWRTPQAKWLALQFACYVGCSLFGVAFYFPFAGAMHLGYWGAAGGAAGFALCDGIGRPIYGWISSYIGRQKTMVYAYSVNVVFQLLAYVFGVNHQAVLFGICAIISGAVSGANFPMTAAIVSDYYGETNNALNYGTVYAWKALGGSFAGGLAAFIMTGTLYGTPVFHWERGFIFGACLGALAALIVLFGCKRPTVAQMERAVAAGKSTTEPAKTAIA
jgi:OFA family oxalate/formate antiporter-like MFS transporter